MKKTIFILLLCLASVSVQAQEGFSYSAELVAGVGFGKGPLFSVTPEFVVQYELDGGFKAGVGAGLRYARPCTLYTINEDGTHSRSFNSELDLPVFLRLGYGAGWLFAQVDGGYSIGAPTLFSHLDVGLHGFFVEPQLGCKIGDHSALAVGVLMHQNTLTISHLAEGTSESRKVLAPAVTLRYAVLF